MDNFIIRINKLGFIKTANNTAIEFYGLDQAKPDRFSIFDFTHPDDKSQAQLDFNRWLKSEQQKYNTENRQLSISGEIYDIQWDLSVDKENPKIIICQGKNITKSKQAARLDTFTQFTINQVKTAIFWCNADGTFFYVNPTACEWLGYTFEELMKMHVADINPEFPREAWEEHWIDIKNNGIVHMESFHQRKNGEKYPVELYSNYVQFEGEEYKLSFVNDITEKRKTDEELNAHRNHLERLVEKKTQDLDKAINELKLKNDELQSKNLIISNQNKELKTTLQNLKETQAQLVHSEKMASLGVLTAGVAHEINNPLNYLMGAYIGLDNFFTEDVPQYKEDVLVLLNGLKTGIERAASIVNSLNQFSRDNKAFNEDCNIHSIIDNCLVMLHNQYKQHITIHKSFCEDDLIIKGNVGKIHQVFINILSNSIQSIKDEGDLTISTFKNPKQIKIIISDTGEGIAPNDIDKITDPFFTTKNPGEGTGLGLYLTYKIIKEHNGHIQFDSEKNKGTDVKIELPY